jgi:hypothetical protein
MKSKKTEVPITCLNCVLLSSNHETLHIHEQ